MCPFFSFPFSSPFPFPFPFPVLFFFFPFSFFLSFSISFSFCFSFPFPVPFLFLFLSFSFPFLFPTQILTDPDIVSVLTQNTDQIWPKLYYCSTLLHHPYLPPPSHHRRRRRRHHHHHRYHCHNCHHRHHRRHRHRHRHIVTAIATFIVIIILYDVVFSAPCLFAFWKQAAAEARRKMLEEMRAKVEAAQHFAAFGSNLFQSLRWNYRASKTPYAPCMVYLPTFGWFLGQMLVNISAPSSTMEHIGDYQSSNEL